MASKYIALALLGLVALASAQEQVDSIVDSISSFIENIEDANTGRDLQGYKKHTYIPKCDPPAATPSPCVASPPPCTTTPVYPPPPSPCATPSPVATPSPCVASPPPCKVYTPSPKCSTPSPVATPSPCKVYTPSPKCYTPSPVATPSPCKVTVPSPKCYTPSPVATPSPCKVYTPSPKCATPSPVATPSPCVKPVATPSPSKGAWCGWTKKGHKWSKKYCSHGQKCCKVPVSWGGKSHGPKCGKKVKTTLQCCKGKCPKYWY